MKKYILGVVTGIMIAGSTYAFADPNPITVTTRLVNFVFNGNKAVTETVEYQGHLYVPVRFVGENMGSLVNWSEANSTVSFESIPAGTVSTYKGDPEIPKIQSSLPSTVLDNITISVQKVSTKDNQILVGVKIENLSPNPIHLDQISGENDNGVNFNINVNQCVDLVDQSLMQNIKPGANISGTIIIPMNLGDISSLNLDLKIMHLAGENLVDTYSLKNIPIY